MAIFRGFRKKQKSNCYINRINANVYSNKYYICNL